MIILIIFEFFFCFNQEFAVHVSEEFIEHCTDGALSIEVWGHRSTGFEGTQAWEIENFQAKSRSLMDRSVLGQGH